ncbi:MAG: hypothetical protein MUE52_10310 [Tabrizicola sp.]|nr:hypothetical protein [Tabrizicola sp.]
MSAPVAKAVKSSGTAADRPATIRPELAVLGGDPAFPVAAALRRAGANVLDAEPPPEGTSDALAQRYGFGLASVRAGRLDSLGLMRNLVEEALTDRQPRHLFWTQPDGQVIDGFRAAIDPQGLPDLAAASSYRKAHLAALRRVLTSAPILILCLTRTGAMVDPADGSAFPEPPPGTVLPPSANLAAHAPDPAELDADFATLHGILQAANPGLRLRVVVKPAGSDPVASRDEATLRACASGWAGRFPSVSADPLFDHLLDRTLHSTSGSGDDSAIFRVLVGLAEGADLAVLLGAGPASAPSPSPPQLDKAARRERRKLRQARRQKSKKDSSVVCEDELLEAFS